MSKPVNKTAIGIFVVIALALLVVAVVIAGSGKFFKQKTAYEMVMSDWSSDVCSSDLCPPAR